MAFNWQGLVLDSQARTTNTASEVINNTEWKGVTLFVNVTAASGTGGLVIDFRFHDPITGTSKLVAGGGQAITATGTYVYQLYPGVSTGANAGIYATASLALMAQWSVTVTHLDGSSYTYSIGACQHV